MTFHSISEIHALLPGLDCGLCGNPVCLTLARKIAVGAQDPQDCKVIMPEDISKIEGLVQEGIEKVSILRRNKDGITEIHPCTENGKVTLEIQWEPNSSEDQTYTYDFFCPEEMCERISNTTFFDVSKCSPELGYALGESKGKRVHIFKTGRVIMRRAESKEDAINTVNHVADILWPIRICSCGNVLIDCFGGACDHCSRGKCSSLSDHYSNETSVGKITQARTLDEKKPSKIVPMFLSALDNFQGIIENMEDSRYNAVESTIEQIDNQARALIEMRSILGFVLLGLSRNMRRICDALFKLKGADEQGYFKEALAMISVVEDIFKDLNAEPGVSLLQFYEKYVKNWDPSMPPEIAKVASNTYYIMRILGKPIPDSELTYIKENDM